MVSPILLISWSVVLGQIPEPANRPGYSLLPQLMQGLELIYRGTCLEEDLVPGVQHQQHYSLEIMLFVLQPQKAGWEVAFQTTITGLGPKNESPKELVPGSVRLEVFSLDRQGKLLGNPGPVPLNGPPTLEIGPILEAPFGRVGLNDFWEIAEEGRPPRTWMIVGTEIRNGLTCLKIVGSQQSDDWDLPRADRTGWKRKDIVWFAPQLGLVSRVERTVERRDPARREPTHRTVTAYDLDSRLKYPGKLYEDRYAEITRFRKIQDEAAPFLKRPAGSRGALEQELRKLQQHQQSHAATPYRKAVVFLQTRLEKARSGELAPEVQASEEPAIKGPVGLGQRVPDFVITDLLTSQSLRLYRLLGRPILVFYYNPSSPVSRDVLQFARRLQEQHANNLSVMALAVSDNVDLVRKQHSELNLPFSILDGKAMHYTFGVDATPRVLLLDGDAVVRTAFTGWGAHSGDEIQAEILRCLPR